MAIQTGWFERPTGKHETAVFDPARSIWKPQLFLNTLEALGGLLTISGKPDD